MSEFHEICLPERLDEKWLFDSFSRFQLECRGAGGSSIQLDFSKVGWVDPLPMLSVMLEIDHALAHGSVHDCVVVLSNGQEPDLEPTQERFGRFLAVNGFIYGLGKLCKMVQIKHARFMGNAPCTMRSDDAQ